MRRFSLLAMLLLSGCGLPGSEWVSTQVGLGGGARPTTTGNDAAQARTLYLDLIRGLRERGLNRAALAHLDEFERLHGRTQGSDLQRGQALAEVGDEATAAEVLARVTGGREEAAANNAMGLLAARGRQWDRAAERFGAAVRLEPTNVRYINNLGYAHLHRRQLPEAELRLRMAHELEPENTEVRNNLALLMLASGRAPAGEQLLAQADSPDTRNAIRREAQRLASAARNN